MMVGKVKVAKGKVAKLGIEEPRCPLDLSVEKLYESPNCGVLVVFLGNITRSKKGKGHLKAEDLGV